MIKFNNANKQIYIFWYSLGLHTSQSPLEFRIGSPSASTLIMEIGYTDGIIRDTKPIAPTVLSTLTEIK